MDGERIAKVLARSGVASRRGAERMIAEGRIGIDGKVATTPAINVTSANRITVDGQALAAPERVRMWLYNKPKGLITSHRDPANRPTVFAALPDDLPPVISIGRLDLNAEGLLLLTNDGGLARRLELPSTGWVRRYRVRVFGTPDAKALAKLQRGITVDDIAYGPIAATVERGTGANCWLAVSLREGKNREIRRAMEAIGHPVSRLIRVAYGPFQLGKLESGAVREVPPKVLREQLGMAPGSAKPGAAAPGSTTAHK